MIRPVILNYYLIGTMNYIKRLNSKRVTLYNNFIYNYSATMKRATPEQNVEDDGQDFNENEGSAELQQDGTNKRVNMPKKSKYRTRAHVNPMGDLNIPT